MVFLLVHRHTRYLFVHHMSTKMTRKIDYFRLKLPDLTYETCLSFQFRNPVNCNEKKKNYGEAGVGSEGESEIPASWRTCK